MRAVALALALVCGAAQAESVRPCDWQARADMIAEPWEQNSRSFANGAVRLALLDGIEPALVPFHLLVLSPPYDAVGGRQCRVISRRGGHGFAALFFEDLTADYDAARGLVFRLPAITIPALDDQPHVSATVQVVLNQASGAITVTEEVTSR